MQQEVTELFVYELVKEHETQFHDNPNYVTAFELLIDIILSLI